MSYCDGFCDVSVLEGKVLSNCYQNGSGEIVFETTDNQQFVMFHDQDCCESVNVEDICGEFEDLIGSPILRAEEITGTTPDEFNPEEYESYTWTFYKIDTARGGVTIRWFGESNGYHSESVSFKEVT